MNEMKQNIQELNGLYKNYMALKKVIEGTAYLSDDGVLIELAALEKKKKKDREEENV